MYNLWKMSAVCSQKKTTKYVQQLTNKHDQEKYLSIKNYKITNMKSFFNSEVELDFTIK